MATRGDEVKVELGSAGGYTYKCAFCGHEETIQLYEWGRPMKTRKCPKCSQVMELQEDDGEGGKWMG